MIELLLVIAIIALLVALLLPVFQQARKKSYEPVCTSNLRQFYVAFSLYREDYGDTARFQAMLLPYVRDKRILHCPMDNYRRGAGWWGSDKGDGWIETSYFYYRPFTDRYLQWIQQVDANHGIAVCVLHGKRRMEQASGAAELIYVGKVIRLRVDGSVSPAYAPLLCFKNKAEQGEMRHPWYLYTDIRPIPQEVLRLDPALREAVLKECE